MTKVFKQYVFVILATIVLAFLYGSYDSFLSVLSKLGTSEMFMSLSSILFVGQIVFMVTVEFIELVKVIRRLWNITLPKLKVILYKDDVFVFVQKVIVVLNNKKLNVMRC